MKLECPNSILFIGRRKDNLRQVLDPNRFEDGETIHLRHLHIEKNDVGFLFLNRAHGFFAVAAFANYFDFVIVLRQSTNEFSGQRFVVYDHSLNRRVLHAGSTERLRSVRKGISTRTARPPSGLFANSKRKFGPYNWLRRRRQLLKPNPRSSGLSSEIPGPLSLTVSRSNPLSCLAV